MSAQVSAAPRVVVALAAALALALQWVVLHALHVRLDAHWEALLAGAGIFGAAFLLSWAAEVAQMDVPQALALAFLALVAVLPEYAVDIYFAWEAGRDPAYTAYATANMTGANRLLIGVGWASVVIAVWLKTGVRTIVISSERRVELFYLLLATGYSLAIPFKATLSVWDTLALLTVFVLYAVGAARAQFVEPELEGVSGTIAELSVGRRRAATLALFLVAGLAIFLAAEPFAEGLLETGRRFGVEEFLLVQWLAPLASESPEFIVAILFAWRGNASAGMGTLIASKVNQWTLLIGMLPLAYGISSGHLGNAMHLDARQAEEILLTASQSLFAVVLLADFRFSIWDGAVILALFATQLPFTDPVFRYYYSFIYLALSIGLIVVRSDLRAELARLLRHGPRP